MAEDQQVRKGSTQPDDDINEAAQRRLDAVRSRACAATEALSQGRTQFEKNLNTYWGRPLNLLELFIQAVTEASVEFTRAHHDEAVASDDEVHNALTRLLGRGCLVARATLTLLRGGYPDDAIARWRSLHELAITAIIIGEHGQELAERYMLHAAVESYKLASDFPALEAMVGRDALPPGEFEKLKAERDRLVERFGKSFGRDLGWAACIFDGKVPTMMQIEKRVGLQDLRALYRWASDNVHPSVLGTMSKLGLDLHKDEAHLVLPSMTGLAPPGGLTAMSLFLIAGAALSTKRTDDNRVTLSVLNHLLNEVGEAFANTNVEIAASVKDSTIPLHAVPPLSLLFTDAT